MNEWSNTRWAYETGIENLRGRLQTGDHLLAQANTLLTIVLAGVGGGLALGGAIFTPEASPLAWGAAISVAWLAVVGVFLAHWCIVTKQTEVLHNEPSNIHRPDLGLSEQEALAFEIENIQGRIEKTKKRNAGVALWLDRCRYGVIATPVWFAATAFLAGR